MAFKVAFDAGHGGNNSTPGKRTPSNEYEWNFNNKVALAFEEELRKYENIELLRTDDRTGKTDVPLKTRVDKANKWGANLYVSFHENALAGKWGSHTGTETFYSKGSTEGKKLARLVHNAALKAYGLRDRGLKTNTLYITKETKMPAVLVEGAFMDSNIDIKKLRDNSVLKNSGKYIAQAVAEYGKLKKKKIKESVVNKSDGKLYRVQTGAFSNKNNAINLSKRLEGYGYSTYLIELNGLFKVQIGAFEVKANADKLVKELKSKSFDAFITTKSGKSISNPQTVQPTPQKPKQPSKPKANLKVDGHWGVETTKALQRYFGTIVDGKISKPSMLIKEIQKVVGARVDGYLGKETITKMQKHFGTIQDGVISRPSNMVKELQRRLNQGKF